MAKTYLRGVTYQAFMRFKRKQIVRLTFSDGLEVASHDALNLFNERVNQAAKLLSATSSLLLNLSAAIFFTLFALTLAPKEITAGLLLLVVLIYPLKRFASKLSGFGNNLVADSENAIKYLLSGIKNIFLLKLYGKLNKEIENIDLYISNYESNYKKYFFITSLKDNLPTIFGIFIIALLTTISVNYFETEKINLISFFYIFIRLAQSTSEISATFSNIRLQLPGIKILHNWVEEHSTKAEKKSGNESSSSLKLIDSKDPIVIEAKEVSFSYQKDKPVIKKLNFSVETGSPLIIKGASGSGKSTLLKLICGMKVPDDGAILINNYSSHKIFASISSRVCYVGPDPFLINGTVRENLTYGNDHSEPTTDEIWSALERAEAKEFIKSFDKELEETLFELSQLSTGQRQRLSIARALLRKPDLMILDEATANLDEKTEKKIVENLNIYFVKVPTIIVSHRPVFDHLSMNIVQL